MFSISLRVRANEQDITAGTLISNFRKPVKTQK